MTNSTGADYCTVNNCILYYNVYGDYSAGTLSYCCTPVLPDGAGNFTNAPQFLNLAVGDFRLQSGSPCVNAGYNAYAPGATDRDSNARIAGGTVDVGAYEFQGSTSLISHAWLLQYGLPTDGSADLADPDGDGLNNWQEWVAGTVPTDATSSLRLLDPTLPAVTLRWLSGPGHKSGDVS